MKHHEATNRYDMHIWVMWCCHFRVCHGVFSESPSTSRLQRGLSLEFYSCGPHLLGLLQRCHKSQPLLCLHLAWPSVRGWCWWAVHSSAPLHLEAAPPGAVALEMSLNIGIQILNRLGVTVKSRFKPPLPPLHPLALLPLLPLPPLSPAPRSLALPLLQSAPPPPAPAGMNKDGQALKEIPCLPRNSAHAMVTLPLLHRND